MAAEGWVDLQVNGYAGVDFSVDGLALDDVFAVADRLAARGTGAFLPTVVTTSSETYRRNLPVLARAARERPEQILGIHLEGPFISPQPGAVGAHPARYVVPPTPDAVDRLLDLAEGAARLVTLAPEEPGALDAIARLAERGVACSLGHSLMDGARVRAAADAGARLATHFGNGLPNQIHRHDNPYWAVFSEPRLTLMVIADGHHLPPDVLLSLWHLRGAEKLLLVSDAAPVAGLPPGEYDCFGTRVRVEPSGRIANLNAPTLAGSGATLADCVRHFAGLVDPGDDALRRLARDNPLRAIGL